MLVYAFTLQYHKTKLENRDRKLVFLGYKVCFIGSVLLNFNTKELFISRHTSFHEHIIPYQTTNHSLTINWTIYPTNTVQPQT